MEDNEQAERVPKVLIAEDNLQTIELLKKFF